MNEVTVHVHNGIRYSVNSEGRCDWYSCTHNVYNSFDEPESVEVMRTITLNDDDMREPCEHNDLYTCGHCNRSWCGTCNPTPSARCPFEYEHEYEDEPDADFPYRDDADDEVKSRSPDYEAEFLDAAIVNDIVRENTLRNQVNPQANGPCPTCGEPNGFHDDNMHRKNIDPKYLLEKGWHNAK